MLSALGGRSLLSRGTAIALVSSRSRSIVVMHLVNAIAIVFWSVISRMNLRALRLNLRLLLLQLRLPLLQFLCEAAGMAALGQKLRLERSRPRNI
jgi:hypothetical protein